MVISDAELAVVEVFKYRQSLPFATDADLDIDRQHKLLNPSKAEIEHQVNEWRRA